MDFFHPTLCQLCAIPATVARSRTSTEPPEASLMYTGETFLQSDYYDECTQPGSASGCSIVPRGNRFEHLSGPGCRTGRAYSGANISIEEMKGCGDLRALISKSPEQIDDFDDESDDEPWERETRYFLSGTNKGSSFPYNDSLQNLQSFRHGHVNIPIFNVFGEDPSTDDYFPIPIHPTCWQVFQRVSTHTLGFVDVHGFWKFRTVSSPEDFHEHFPRHPAVRAGLHPLSTDWIHELGSEWLIANPVDVPGLVDRLQSCVGSSSNIAQEAPEPSTSPAQRNEATNPPSPSPPHGHDSFTLLPPELKLMIQSLLPSPSLAALCLASRAMTHIPNIVFRKLVLEDDLPWLWEAGELPIRETNWLEVYTKAKSEWSVRMKGLKNRRRIWGEVGEICTRIKGLREEGMVRGWTGWEEEEKEEEEGEEGEEGGI